MARRPRFPLTEVPLHIVQRGNDRRRCFFDELDYRVYLRAVSDASARYGVAVHAYALMTNHVHLLVTPAQANGVSRLMQSVAARYVWHVNASKSRSGTLWEGRYKACLVERDEHVLAACRYIDLNPVRAGLVSHPSQYPWSSYAALAELRVDPLVVPHDALEQIGRPRGEAYSRWCSVYPAAEWDRLRQATERQAAFGSDGFLAEIEARTLRPMVRRGRGRPPKSSNTCAT